MRLREKTELGLLISESLSTAYQQQRAVALLFESGGVSDVPELTQAVQLASAKHTEACSVLWAAFEDIPTTERLMRCTHQREDETL